MLKLHMCYLINLNSHAAKLSHQSKIMLKVKTNMSDMPWLIKNERTGINHEPKPLDDDEDKTL